MDEAEILRYLADTFAPAHIVSADGNHFIFDNPERKMPFATIVTNDAYEAASNLSRPGAFRLSIGVSSQTYTKMFGPVPANPPVGGVVPTGHDFTALDMLVPHPIYAAYGWVCILSPGAATFETVKPLLAEAYALAAGRGSK